MLKLIDSLLPWYQDKIIISFGLIVNLENRSKFLQRFLSFFSMKFYTVVKESFFFVCIEPNFQFMDKNKVSATELYSWKEIMLK